jgi:hypothetical protein
MMDFFSRAKAWVKGDAIIAFGCDDNLLHEVEAFEWNRLHWSPIEDDLPGKSRSRIFWGDVS